MIEIREVVEKRICKNCRWVKYYGAGIWLCVREGKRLEEGVLEVNPLQRGCEWWQDKEEVKDEI